jgi:DNA-binding NarL/FixJ family response regulator
MTCPVEEAKPEIERGFYLHSDVFNQVPEKSIDWARDPERLRQVRQQRQGVEKVRHQQGVNQLPAADTPFADNGIDKRLPTHESSSAQCMGTQTVIMSESTDSNIALPLIKVAIIEDRREIREGLATLLQFTEGFRCVGRFHSMEDALAKIGANIPDVALVDIGLPGMSGIEGIPILKERFPHLLPLALTVYDDDERIFRALCAGACGYLLKKTPPAKLLDSLKEVVAGGAPMSPQVARRVVALFRKFSPPPDVDYQLTAHEARLLRLLVDGHNYKTAAAKLNVSVNTVSFHMRHIYDKLQVHSKSEAVAKALRQGIV